MAKYIVELHVDEEKVKNVSECESVNDAFLTEMSWVNGSGINIENYMPVPEVTTLSDIRHNMIKYKDIEDFFTAMKEYRKAEGLGEIAESADTLMKALEEFLYSHKEDDQDIKNMLKEYEELKK